ncbi:DUF72 domain-containing protein [Sphingomonas ginkgonis]|uniref:DUF72 domain-containing protein n=1 Tax=Sphingomonas ginkgonis TaxID=2315330 RepID=A0A3R9WQ90_9SPHN|nr:DUF72 domain-containing protein [Sphingomonas ginkgonis]RST31760.1 DUF72 domain-containing protein [Sphingomonas ginkgonis]
MAGRIRIGIGGWTYEPWRGLFYPEGLPHRRELEFASERMGAIEINSTFYSRQSPASWQKWADSTPDDFRFSLKASRFCVTRPRLADAGDGIATYLAQGMDRLDEKLGPILWMLAARRQFDADDIAAFLKLLPAKLGPLPLRHVIEPRHESFRDERFYRLCRDRNVAIVFGDDDEFPCIDADTANFRYARLQRMREEVTTGYDRPSLDRFAAMATGWQRGEDCFLFLINGAKLRAPAAALALQQRLGIAPA